MCEEMVNLADSDYPWHHHEGSAVCLHCIAAGIIRGHVEKTVNQNLLYTLEDYLDDKNPYLPQYVFHKWSGLLTCMECRMGYSPEFNDEQKRKLIKILQDDLSLHSNTLSGIFIETIQEKNREINDLRQELQEYRKFQEDFFVNLKLDE
jgi:hypothetical protein